MTCMAEGIHELMTGGCQKKPSEKMCQWIDEVWHDYPREKVAKSFLKINAVLNILLIVSKIIFYLKAQMMSHL